MREAGRGWTDGVVWVGDAAVPGARAALAARGAMTAGVWILAAVALVAALAFAGCASEESSRARVEQCVDRLVAQTTDADAQTLGVAAARRKIEDEYCSQFEERSWIYEDGALDIEAHRWAIEHRHAQCESSGESRSSLPTFCDQLRRATDEGLIDCTFLHHVQREQAQEYVEQLRRERDVECNDGTALEDLGAT